MYLTRIFVSLELRIFQYTYAYVFFYFFFFFEKILTFNVLLGLRIFICFFQLFMYF